MAVYQVYSKDAPNRPGYEAGEDERLFCVIVPLHDGSTLAINLGRPGVEDIHQVLRQCLSETGNEELAAMGEDD